MIAGGSLSAEFAHHQRLIVSVLETALRSAFQASSCAASSSGAPSYQPIYSLQPRTSSTLPSGSSSTIVLGAPVCGSVVRGHGRCALYQRCPAPWPPARRGTSLRASPSGVSLAAWTRTPPRGAIPIARDHLRQHLFGFGIHGGIFPLHGPVHRDLRPHQQPHLIGQAGHHLVVRIVRQADEVAAHLFRPAEPGRGIRFRKNTAGTERRFSMNGPRRGGIRACRSTESLCRSPRCSGSRYVPARDRFPASTETVYSLGLLRRPQ